MANVVNRDAEVTSFINEISALFGSEHGPASGRQILKQIQQMNLCSSAFGTGDHIQNFHAVSVFAECTLLPDGSPRFMRALEGHEMAVQTYPLLSDGLEPVVLNTVAASANPELLSLGIREVHEPSHAAR